VNPHGFPSTRREKGSFVLGRGGGAPGGKAKEGPARGVGGKINLWGSASLEMEGMSH